MITFDTRDHGEIWQRFSDHCNKITSVNWQNELNKFNGTDMPATPCVQFDTEEDMVVFILRFS